MGAYNNAYGRKALLAIVKEIQKEKLTKVQKVESVISLGGIHEQLKDALKSGDETLSDTIIAELEYLRHEEES